MSELVYQAQEKGCGYAAVKMALVFFSKDSRYRYLDEPIGDKAPDLAALIAYARQAGLRLEAYETPNPLELTQERSLPLILLLREQGTLHAVFVPRRGKRHFVVLDPLRGRLVVRADDLASRFSGQYLVVKSYEEKRDLRPSPGFHLPLPSKPVGIFLLGLVALLPMALVLFGILSIDFSFPAVVSILALLLGIFLSMAFRAALLRAMERFDEKYMDGVDDDLPQRRREKYVHYHSYKRAVFLSPVEVLGRLGGVLAALVFLLLTNTELGIASAILIALVSIGHILIYPKRRKLEREAMDLEGQYFALAGDLDIQRHLRKHLRKNQSDYALFLSLQRGILGCSSLGLGFLYAFWTGQWNVPSIAIATLILTYLGMETEHVYASEPLWEEKKKEEPYFLLQIASKAKDE